MIYVQITSDGKVWPAVYAQAFAAKWVGFESRHDWKTFKRVQELADRLTETTLELYIATDSGENVWPRFDVIQAPKVGDEVSYTFNGDYYPTGKITNISKSLKVITTSEGKKFYRHRNTGTWLNNKTWSLIQGHHDDRNPSF